MMRKIFATHKFPSLTSSFPEPENHNRNGACVSSSGEDDLSINYLFPSATGLAIFGMSAKTLLSATAYSKSRLQFTFY